MTTKKTCYCCGRTLPLEAFYRHCTKKYGRTDECRKCKRIKKTCYCCGRALLLKAFYRHRTKKYGRADECRECKRKINEKYRGKPISGRRMAFPRDPNREPLYFVDEARIESIRRLLAVECKVYWLPSSRRRCPHGRWEEECAECERKERALLGINFEEEIEA